MSFDLIKVNDLISTQPENQWLIEGIIEQDCIGMLFGKPASAKSFIALDIAYCVAQGIDWNGYTTSQGKVVYIAGEGFNGLSKRFKALSTKYSTEVPEDLFVSTMPVSLIEADAAKELSEKIDSLCSQPHLIIIDTFNRNFGGDENSAKDVSQFISNLDTYLKHTNVTILIIHHSGHSNTDRARGSTAILGALDVEYKISKTNNLVTMKCTKAKDHSEAKDISFELVTQEIPDWLDPHGNAVTSATLEPTTSIVPSGDVAMTGNLKIVYESLEAVIESDGEPLPQSILDISPELRDVKCVQMQQWKDKAYIALGDRQLATKQRALSRGKITLSEGLGRVTTQDDLCWINI